MKNIRTQFVPLGVLAIRLRLPAGYLRGLADKKMIPFLDVNGRRRFNTAAVWAALDELARRGSMP